MTGLTLISFGLMVLSSLLAAWTDISSAISTIGTAPPGTDSSSAAAKLGNLNAGYLWMMVNCITSASYVLAMRKRIKVTNFKVSSIMRLRVSSVLADSSAARRTGTVRS